MFQDALSEAVKVDFCNVLLQIFREQARCDPEEEVGSVLTIGIW